MAEKIFNTRILNKVDTLENWNKSTLPLKKGEIALATVAASAGIGLSEPVVMIKIGEDGVKTFKDLDWNVYAKSSDVLAACKSESTLTTFINNVIGDASLATNEEFTALTGRMTTAEGDIDALEGRATSLEGLVGSTAVATQISNAISALNLPNTYAAKVHTHTKSDITDFDHTHTTSEITDFDSSVKAYDYATKSEAQGYANAKDAAIQEAKDAADAAQEYAEGVAGDLAGEVSAREAADTAINNKIGTVATGKTVVQMIADAQTAATYDDTAVKQDIADLEGLVGTTKVSTQISDAVATEKSRAEAAEKVNADAIAAIKEDVDAFFKDADMTASAKDTLKELQEYIASDESGASSMAASIKQNADDIDALEGEVATKAAQSDLTALTTRVTTAEGDIDALEDKSHEHSNQGVLDGITSTQVSNWDDAFSKEHTHSNKDLLDTYTQTEANLADAVSKKHDHSNKSVLDGITAAKVSNWDAAQANVLEGIEGVNGSITNKTFTVTGVSTDLLTQGTDTLVFSCGGAN